jgi:tetratricopeptide (TPR) repeat protein
MMYRNEPCVRPLPVLVALLALAAGVWSSPADAASPRPRPLRSVVASTVDEAGFVEGLREVRSLREERDWGKAKERLLALVAEHGDRGYVRIRAAEIREELLRCAVRIAVPPPGERELVRGHLVGYNRASGQIHLAYRSGELGDFEEQPGGDVWIHPVSFSGNYSIEVEGPSYSESSALLVGVHGDEAYLVFFGMLVENEFFRTTAPARVVRVAGDEQEVVAVKDPSPARPGEKYSLKVTVTSRDLTVNYNGRRILRAPKEPDLWGQLGVARPGDFERIDIRGRANSSWLQGLVDAATRDAEREFLATYDPDRELPEWLRAGGSSPAEADPAEASPAEPEAPDQEKLPWLVPAEQLPCARQVAALLARGSHESALGMLDTEKGKALPEDLRAYFASNALAALGRWDRALDLTATLAERNPDFVPVRMLHATVLARLGSYGRAIEEVRAALRRDPRRPEGYRALAELQMLEGRLDEAGETVLEARRAGVTGPEIGEIELVLAKARRGPNWSRSFTHESEHYTITSDIDRKICIEASGVLEETYGRCAERFGEPTRGSGRKFRVYLFAGKERYSDYVRGLFEHKPENTAGIYSYGLKQLLIWNLPDRGDMMETVRHEAVHQYLDLRGADVPIWLNEGLAEYLSYLEPLPRSRRVAEGGVRGAHVRALRARPERLLPLERFFRLQGDLFYRDTAVTYPQAWAFTHFLLHGGEEGRKLYDRLVGAALDGARADAIVESLLREEGITALDAKFRAYVAALEP